MPLIEGRCKNCNGEIKFDSSRDKGFCTFCGTPFLREDLIINQHYHNDFSGANVIFNDLESLEKQLENAENNLTRLKNYDRAEAIYRSITQKASGEYRAWWGLVRAISHEFTDISLLRYNEIEMYANNALKVVDNENIKNNMLNQWNYFRNLVFKNDVSNLERKSNELTIQKNELQKQLSELKSKLVDKNNEITNKNNKANSFKFLSKLFKILKVASIITASLVLFIALVTTTFTLSSASCHFIISVLLFVFACISNFKSKTCVKKRRLLIEEMEADLKEAHKLSGSINKIETDIKGVQICIDECLEEKKKSQSKVDK